MSNVYLAIPSKRPPAECVPILRHWHERGYRVVLQRDEGDSPKILDKVCWDIAERPYAGYAEAVNFLCRQILEDDPHAEWIVTAGDDTLPDPSHEPEVIAAECISHFGGMFGVMQPTGDRWEVNGPGTGAGIDRVAGSAWQGREWCSRMYGGRGPQCEEYYHMGADEELQAVATMLGVFWQRQDLTQAHQHWGRPRPGERMGLRSRMPAFLERANSPEEWVKFRRIFAERKAAGWPGHAPCP